MTAAVKPDVRCAILSSLAPISSKLSVEVRIRPASYTAPRAPKLFFGLSSVCSCWLLSSKTEYLSTLLPAKIVYRTLLPTVGYLMASCLGGFFMKELERKQSPTSLDSEKPDTDSKPLHTQL